ncbi:hypothetical protein IFR05_002201 [Cadophora sp. M221]|nr:hypothetical protein IFR05_002201 [Cadophora sp. M221]
MAAPISDATEDDYSDYLFSETSQDDQVTAEDLVRDVETAYEIINRQEENISRLSEQVKVANNRVAAAERAIQDAGATAVRNVGTSSNENARLRAENNLLNALVAASNKGSKTSTYNASCTNDIYGISEQNLKELLDFENEYTDTAPALESKFQLLTFLLAKCQPGETSGGQLYSGSRTSSGGDYDSEIGEYIRLVDNTIKNAHILRNRVQFPIATIKLESPKQADTSVHHRDDIWTMDPELDEAITEMSLFKDVDADSTRLNDALATATAQIRGLNAKVIRSQTRIDELEASQGLDPKGVEDQILVTERDDPQSHLDYYLKDHAPPPRAKDFELAHLNGQIRNLLADGADLTQRLTTAQDRIFTLESKHLTLAEAQVEQLRLRALLDDYTAQKQALLQNAGNEPALEPDVDIADLSQRANQVYDLEAKLKDANKVINGLQARLAGDRAAADEAEMDSLSKHVQELTQNLDTADQEKGEAEAELAEQKVVVEDLTPQIAVFGKQITDLTAERTEVEKARDDALEEVNNQLSEVDRLQTLLGDSEEGHNQVAPGPAAASAYASAVAPCVETTKLKKQVKELRTERDALQAQLDATEQDPELTATIRGFQTQVDDLDKELKKVQRSQKRGETKATKADAEVTRLCNLLDTMEATVDRIRGERTAARADRDALRLRVLVAEEALGVDQVELHAQLQQASLFTIEKKAFIVDIEKGQKRVGELNQEIKELKELIEELNEDNAKLISDLNNTKIELFDKISGAVDHLRDEEMAKKLAEGLNAGDISKNVGVDIITDDKPVPTREKRLVEQDSSPKRKRKSAKQAETSAKVPEESMEPAKRSTRASKRKTAPSETTTQRSKSTEKKRRKI